MKFIRLTLISLGVTIAVLAVLLAAAFTPAVQTWVAQTMLAGQPGFHGSLGSLSAGLDKVDLADLQFEVGGALVTLPTVQARLPLKTAVWDRRVVIRSLVAKGWTIDLSRNPEPSGPQANSAPASESSAKPDVEEQVTKEAARKAANIWRGIVSEWKLPIDVSLDGVELEGDVLVARSEGDPIRVHMVLTGGGASAGREGVFAIDAVAAAPWLRASTVTAHGRLFVAMNSPRTFNSIELKADLAAKGGALAEDFSMAAHLMASRGQEEETYAVGLSRGSRQFASFLAHAPYATGRLAGTWAVDLRESDWMPFTRALPLPAITAAGDGRFEADASFAKVHVVGHLKGTADHLGVLALPLDHFGPVTLMANFNCDRSDRLIRVNDLGVTFAANGLSAAVQSLQSFDYDERTGGLKLTNEQTDWMEGSVRGMPGTFGSSMAQGITFTGSEVKCDFLLRASDEGFTLRPKIPFTLAGVSVAKAGNALAQNLSLSLSLLANFGSRGWQMEFAPLTVTSGGRPLVTVQAKVSRRAGDDQVLAIRGTWNADLEALAATQPTIPGLTEITARSASGDLSASVGTVSQVIGKVAVVGHDPLHSFTANVHVDVDEGGTVEFQVPAKMSFGPSVSEMLAEGMWFRAGEEGQINVRLTGESVALEHLHRLAGPLAAAAGVTLPASLADKVSGSSTSTVVADRTPFWGQWTGTVTMAFNQMRVGEKVFTNVGGSVDLDHGSLRLERGRCGLSHQNAVQAEGQVSFDAAAEFPYSLKATVSANEPLDAGLLFGTVPPGQDAVLEGRFSVAGTLTGNGRNLADLVDRTQEEFHLTSKVGIVRLLATQVAESLPEEAPSPVSDALDSVGYMMGKLLKVNGRVGSGQRSLSKATEAVLNFSSVVAEIGYDQFAVTAIRRNDGTIRLVDLRMTSPEVSLTGSGQITGAKGLPFHTQPLSLDLTLGTRGKLTEVLSKTDLLSGQKDSSGFVLLRQPIHFGGSLEHIDDKDWRDLLVKAALWKPSDGKSRDARTAP